MIQEVSVINSIKETLRIEAEEILAQQQLVGSDFEIAVDIIVKCTGKVVVTGIGKSGIVCRKIAATLASTGTPSFFLHPSEAFHGDLGMVSSTDVILAISNSGETDELLKIVPYFKENGNRLIALTGNSKSTLATNADVHLLFTIRKEACPLSLAPTSSTTVSLAIGDALAVVVMRIKDFQHDGFAKLHPGGNLGKKLLTSAKNVMRTKDLPLVSRQSKVVSILDEITKARMGLVLVMESERLIGLITDGDLRRHMSKLGKEIFELEAQDIMTSQPRTISPSTKLTEIEDIMTMHKVHSLPVVGNDGSLLGVVERYNTSI
jgi:arabinose-5-phosphate isomerase